MNGPDPAEFGWWLASRAAGVVALLCITVSVGVGLAMAGRLRPALARTLLSVHEQTALVGLVAIAVHAITLLGDRFLSPSIGDIALPFTSAHEPLWTGLGVTAGWLAAILGLSAPRRKFGRSQAASASADSCAWPSRRARRSASFSSRG